MLHSKARWQTGCAESSVVQKLAEAHHLDTLTARLLALRGITTPEAAESFLHSRQDGFHDPFLMKDMKKPWTGSVLLWNIRNLSEYMGIMTLTVLPVPH
ncbi:hypothetical protein [Paenibacillus larvae]|uniref:hypothetical protein n=1 Tax=Paenibacillus larvae TaxID=1464 RepID=UPI00288CF59F|nr:hypothetical protein [Paenibacillus larvae]MDT2193701.1 hypothetical protein [Paenibacillus larvae]MDT2241013.1 hypothetical protein [Paenibacillus larvae]MDT2305818.1 hypothetical protein [Paenibacillus larvae]